MTVCGDYLLRFEKPVVHDRAAVEKLLIGLRCGRCDSSWFGRRRADSGRFDPGFGRFEEVVYDKIRVCSKMQLKVEWSLLLLLVSLEVACRSIRSFEHKHISLILIVLS